MIVTILTLLDVLSAILLIANETVGAPLLLSIWSALYLVGKGLWFRGDIFSWLDVAAGAWILLVVLGVHGIISWIVAGYLLVKSASFLMLR